MQLIKHSTHPCGFAAAQHTGFGAFAP
ncbi:hypothetical protein XAC3608_460108 [Xanthomonas citri pv. citri]|nr:hypothetical protein XAC902_300108 [Xanthomonas citri pv. citri]CEE69541.1 hypothetical protein XAC3608_460108 [Xanthomonas citri pv. citri]CEH59094.1 hypothetical protein XAC3615_3970012 [Xanthomonas citri pv. citri]CEH68014.1 hypothetical protein XACS582_3990017 [Xanthomonas citri pv. citri]CEH94888.1 hypothetical protein XACB302_3360025 [Xanthomonas citri pv. citri]